MSDARQLNEARAMVYQWLSGLLARELSEDDLHLYNGESGQLFFQQLGQEPELTSSVAKIRTALEAIEGREATLNLAADFCGLFLVSGREAVSPYAGAYIEAATGDRGEVALFGETHQRIVAYLRDNDLQVQGDFPEPADHIAVLLSFMAHLCVNEGIDEQRQFLLECLSSWLDRFSARVADCDKGVFYTAVTEFACRWILLEQEWCAV